MNMTRQAPHLRKDAYLQSLDKGLAVLEAFDAQKPTLTISEAAQLTKLDRATTRRALLTLEHLGYLSHDGKRFSLTAKVLGFGYKYLAALPFLEVARPIMEELSDQLNETVSMGVLDGADVVFILRVPAKRLLTFDPSTGSRVPAHVHSMGHALMGSWSEQALEAFLEHVKFHAFTEHSIGNSEALRAKVAEVRANGWSFAARQHEANLGGLAVPLLDNRGNTFAALNVSFIMDSTAEQRAAQDLLPRLLLAARRIQQSL